MPKPRSIYTWTGITHPRRLAKGLPRLTFLDAVLRRVESRRKLIPAPERSRDLMLDTLYQMADKEIVSLRRSGFLQRFHAR